MFKKESAHGRIKAKAPKTAFLLVGRFRRTGKSFLKLSENSEEFPKLFGGFRERPEEGETFLDVSGDYD